MPHVHVYSSYIAGETFACNIVMMKLGNRNYGNHVEYYNLIYLTCHRHSIARVHKVINIMNYTIVIFFLKQKGFKGRSSVHFLGLRVARYLLCGFKFRFAWNSTVCWWPFDFLDHCLLNKLTTSRLLWAQRLINLEIPVLVRSLKSSNIELG